MSYSPEYWSALYDASERKVSELERQRAQLIEQNNFNAERVIESEADAKQWKEIYYSVRDAAQARRVLLTERVSQLEAELAKVNRDKASNDRDYLAQGARVSELESALSKSLKAIDGMVPGSYLNDEGKQRLAIEAHAYAARVSRQVVEPDCDHASGVTELVRCDKCGWTAEPATQSAQDHHPLCQLDHAISACKAMDGHLREACIAAVGLPYECARCSATQVVAEARGAAVGHDGCNYMWPVGEVCNKCGQLVKATSNGVQDDKP